MHAFPIPAKNASFHLQLMVCCPKMQVHINNAGDWTGALHARFCALMHLTHNIKEDLLERVSQSLKEQSIIRKDEQCPEQRLPTTATSNKQASPQLQHLVGNAHMQCRIRSRHPECHICHSYEMSLLYVFHVPNLYGRYGCLELSCCLKRL